MRREFVPMTAHVVRRKPWGKGKKNAPEQKKTKTGRVELIKDDRKESLLQ